MDADAHRFFFKNCKRMSTLSSKMLIAARNWAAQTFLIKILLKSNDFDCPGWPGAAGIEKRNDFY